MKKDYPKARKMARGMTTPQLKEAQKLYRLCRQHKVGHDLDAERIVNDELKRRKRGAK